MSATELWNAAITHRPAAVVTCSSTDDVRAALRRARTEGLRVSVRGGGHDWAGRAVADGGLVVDLSGLRGVTVDGDVATLGGGATSADVMAAAQASGQAIAAGTVGAVGYTGLALGGGYGPLCGRAGLAADTIVGAEVVLADGSVVRADADTEPELFWALRGGGGNFGVVTALRVRLQPVPAVVNGIIAFPWDQAADVLAGWGELAPQAPDELTAQAGVFAGPTGDLLAFLGPTWSGEPAAGGPWLDRLHALGTPVMSTVAPAAPLEPLRQGDAMFAADGRHYAIRTRNVARLTPEVVTTLLAGVRTSTSPLSSVNMHHFHGAASRVPIGSTAFGRRDDHFMVEIIGSWRPGDGSADQGWPDAVDQELRRHALPGGYPNLLAPDATAQIADAYGPNAARLRDAKKRFDPDGVFAATPLPA